MAAAAGHARAIDYVLGSPGMKMLATIGLLPKPGHAAPHALSDAASCPAAGSPMENIVSKSDPPRRRPAGQRLYLRSPKATTGQGRRPPSRPGPDHRTCMDKAAEPFVRGATWLGWWRGGERRRASTESLAARVGEGPRLLPILVAQQ
jgi:hypothetical protein